MISNDSSLISGAIAPSQVARKRKAKVRLHRLGHWFIRHKGRDVYLGTDFRSAQDRAVQLLGPEKVILQTRPPKHANPAAMRRWVAITMKRIDKETKPLKVLQGRTFEGAAGLLLNTLNGAEQRQGRKHVAKTLGAFLENFGKRSVHSLPPEELLKFRASLLEHYSPKTFNHHVATVRRLLRFVYELEWVERPYRVDVLRAVPLGPAPDKALSRDRIIEVISTVADANLNLARMLLLQFYGVMRTTEVPKVVYAEGVFESKYPFVFRLNRGKTDKQTGEATRIVLVPEALQLLEVIERQYPDGDRYGKACTRLQSKKNKTRKLNKAIGPWSPGPLRHSAATMLAEHGIDETTIRAAEHHVQDKITRVYRPPPFAKVRDAMAILPQAVPLSVVGL